VAKLWRARIRFDSNADARLKPRSRILTFH